jgi:hypothetical protein
MGGFVDRAHRAKRPRGPVNYGWCVIEPRLSRELYENGGEEAYIREAIVLTQAENRAQIRDEVQSISVQAVRNWADRAMKKTFRRGYGGETMATIGMCYLVAYYEEWEGLDFGHLKKELLDEAILGHSLMTPEYVALTATIGLGGGLGSGFGFAPLRELLEEHPSTKRMGSVLRPMFSNAVSLRRIKRRHLEDYARACVAAMGIGSALGIVDRTELVPGVAPTRLPEQGSGDPSNSPKRAQQ